MSDPNSSTPAMDAKSKRIAACLSACAGIDDPEAAIKAAKNAILVMIRGIELNLHTGCGVPASVQTRLPELKAALAKLGGPSK